jgi:hypothetical protein
VVVVVVDVVVEVEVLVLVVVEVLVVLLVDVVAGSVVVLVEVAAAEVTAVVSDRSAVRRSPPSEVSAGAPDCTAALHALANRSTASPNARRSNILPDGSAATARSDVTRRVPPPVAPVMEP